MPYAPSGSNRNKPTDHAKNADAPPLWFDLLISKMLEGWEVMHPKGIPQRNNIFINLMLFENGRRILVNNQDDLQKKKKRCEKVKVSLCLIS
jgi:hypothetical protein